MKNVVKVPDDFIFLDETREGAETSLASFKQIASECGVPLAEEKTQGPATSLDFLGYNLDCDNYLISIPGDKIDRYLKETEELRAKDFVTLTQLKSLIGKLQFCVAIMNSGPAFLRSLLAAVVKSKQCFDTLIMALRLI